MPGKKKGKGKKGNKNQVGYQGGNQGKRHQGGQRNNNQGVYQNWTHISQGDNSAFSRADFGKLRDQNTQSDANTIQGGYEIFYSKLY